MPDRIKILDKNVSEKIAAGEVVEKPASVVKELIENSLDASSSRIDVELRDGGRNRIKITDNGIGMSASDAGLAFERHSTSKIREFEDLSRIVSMGFRGEALASIGAVSRVELVTREHDEILGRKIIFEGGLLVDKEETGCPAGTTILVENIFFNVPARRKFMSSSRSEQNAINNVIIRTAIAHHEVFFSLSADRKEICSYQPVPDLLSRVTQIYSNIQDRLIPVKGACEEAILTGLISHPSYTMPNRSRIFIFINKRFVRPGLMYKAIQDSYRRLISPGRFPAVFLFLDIDPHLIDVNIHPAKEDVKFLKEGLIFSLITKTISNALAPGSVSYDILPGENRQSTSISFHSISSFTDKNTSPLSCQIELPDFYRENHRLEETDSNTSPVPCQIEPPDFYRENHRLKEEETFTNSHDRMVTTKHENVFSHYASRITHHDSHIKSSCEENMTEKSYEKQFSQAGTQVNVIGNFKDIYIIVLTENEILLIDQHVAHERINFELLKGNISGNSPSQSLLLPFTLEFSSPEAEWLRENMSFLSSLGFELEDFGENTFLLRGFPSGLDRIGHEEFLKDLVSEFAFSEKKISPELLFNNIMASIACKASVKAGDRLSREEMTGLVQRLFKTENPLYCPHGRPVIISFSERDLGKLFKRYA
jgi:DNA mismatch repair protein MutL